jgi:hypothetical protein
LNAIVSAAVTLGVLWWWDRTHPSSPNDCSPNQSGVNTQEEQITIDQVIQTEFDSLPPLDETVLMIENVFGVGDPENEVVVITRVGEGDLSLAGWSLRDEDGHIYTFPQLSLNKGSIQLYTYPGNSGLENGLHWGLTEAVWSFGETVTILDAQGNIRATYLIP